MWPLGGWDDKENGSDKEEESKPHYFTSPRVFPARAAVFSASRHLSPYVSMLRQLGGDIETNTGPPVYICRICNHIINKPPLPAITNQTSGFILSSPTSDLENIVKPIFVLFMKLKTQILTANLTRRLLPQQLTPRPTTTILTPQTDHFQWTLHFPQLVMTHQTLSPISPTLPLLRPPLTLPLIYPFHSPPLTPPMPPLLPNKAMT